MKFTILVSFLLLSSAAAFANTDTTKHHSPHYRNLQLKESYYNKVVTNDTVTLLQPSVTINDSVSVITKLYIQFPNKPYNNEWRSLFIYPHIDTIKFINGTLDSSIVKANKLTFRRFHYESADNKWHWYTTHPIYYTGQKQAGTSK